MFWKNKYSVKIGDEPSDNLKGLIILLIVIFCFWSLFIILQIFFPQFDKKLSEIKSLDLLNTLFTGLSLAAIIFTVYQQKKELGLQRQELKATRIELSKSAIAQEKSEIALNRQVENLKISAKLSALNTLVTYYSDQENKLLSLSVDPKGLHDFRLKKENCVRKIEEILQRKEQ